MVLANSSFLKNWTNNLYVIIIIIIINCSLNTICPKIVLLFFDNLSLGLRRKKNFKVKLMNCRYITKNNIQSRPLKILRSHQFIQLTLQVCLPSICINIYID